MTKVKWIETLDLVIIMEVFICVENILLYIRREALFDPFIIVF